MSDSKSVSGDRDRSGDPPTPVGRDLSGDPPEPAGRDFSGDPPEPAGHLDGDTCVDIVAGLAAPEVVDRAVEHARLCSDCEAMLMAAGGDLESFRARPAPARLPMRHRPVRILRVAVPLALAAALAVVVLRGLPRDERAPTGEPYWIPATGELLRLRDAHGSEADSIFWIGLDAYAGHRIEEVREYLGRARATGGLEDLRRLYLAGAHVNAGAGREALALLKALKIEELPLPWREDARWLEYRALRQLGRRDEARRLLERMAAWPGRVGDLARQEQAAGSP